MNCPDNYSGNEKFEQKMRDLESLFEIINQGGTITASPSVEQKLKEYLEQYSKEISPLFVQKLLDIMLLYITRYEFKDIPMTEYVTYLFKNSTARVRCKYQSQQIFKKLYELLPSEVLLALFQFLKNVNQIIQVLHGVEIVKYLLTLKQFGSLQQRFAQFDQLCTPHMIDTLRYTTQYNLKRGYIDLLQALIKELGSATVSNHLNSYDLNVALPLKEDLEKKLNITLPGIKSSLIPKQEKCTQLVIEQIVEETLSTPLMTPPLSPIMNPKNSKPIPNALDQYKEKIELQTTKVAQEVAKEYIKKVEGDGKEEQKSLKVKLQQRLEIVSRLQTVQEKPSGRDELFEQKRRLIELEKLKQELDFIQNVVLQDYNKFSTKNYKEKYVLIETLYSNLTNGSVRISEAPITAATIVDFFKFENTKGLSLSIKILKIFMMVQESSIDKMKAFFKSHIQEILIASIKSLSVSKNVLLYQVISLFQMIYELKVFNSELLSAIYVSLLQDSVNTQKNALDILSNFIMRNSIPNDSIFHEILIETSQLAASSANYNVRAVALQILVQAQQKIGDKINYYIGKLRFCQLREFKKAIKVPEMSPEEMNLKEKSKCSEIEFIICQQNIKNEGDLVKLITNEIDFYNKRQKNEFSLDYVKIFSHLLQKPSKYVVKNTLMLLSHTFKQFKPSEILSLFDLIINIKSCTDPVLHKKLLVSIIQHHGFGLFYSKIILYISQKKHAHNAVSILRNLINDMSESMLSEIIEIVLKLIDGDQMELNNMIYHFLALACISRGEQHVENIIQDKYDFAAHLLKKVQREKEKCLYLIHLASKGKISNTTLSNKQSSQNFELMNLDFNLLSFMTQQNEQHNEQFLKNNNIDSSKIDTQINDEESSNAFSFVNGDDIEDEV